MFHWTEDIRRTFLTSWHHWVWWWSVCRLLPGSSPSLYVSCCQCPARLQTASPCTLYPLTQTSQQTNITSQFLPHLISYFYNDWPVYERGKGVFFFTYTGVKTAQLYSTASPLNTNRQWLLTRVWRVDDVIPRQGHHNVMDGVVVSLLCRQHVGWGFINIIDQTLAGSFSI